MSHGDKTHWNLSTKNFPESNITPFSIMDLSIRSFWYPWESLSPSSKGRLQWRDVHPSQRLFLAGVSGKHRAEDRTAERKVAQTPDPATTSHTAVTVRPSVRAPDNWQCATSAEDRQFLNLGTDKGQ